MELTREIKAKLACNYSASALRSAGYSASALRSAGYSASDVLSAGYSASALLSAGYSASDVLSAGYSASALRSAGYSASDVLSAGYSASALRSAGYSASALRSAGYSASALLSAGYSASALLSAGYSASDVRELEELEDSIPLVDKPYSKMWTDIQAGERCHKQSTFGPDSDPVTNVCGTAMCTAGHLVQMGGELGWKLRQKFGFAGAAALIHDKSHPGWPCQNFGNINQDFALAYIEEMARWEAEGVSGWDAVEPVEVA